MQTQESSAILIGRATFGLYVTICWIVIETQRRGTEPQFAATAPTAGLGELRNRVAHHLGREADTRCARKVVSESPEKQPLAACFAGFFYTGRQVAFPTLRERLLAWRAVR